MSAPESPCAPEATVATVGRQNAATTVERSRSESLLLEPDLAPLSFSQQRLWFLERLHPGTPTYSIPFALRLKGHLDVRALQRAILSIAERHEVLRTRFTTLDGEPWQDAWPVSRLTVPIVSLTEPHEGARENLLQQRLEREARRAFQVASEPLFRCNIFRLCEKEHVLFVNMHHSVSDATSLSIFLSELASHYRAFHSGASEPLPALPIQYADYAVWQREQAEPDTLRPHVEFWRKELAGVPAELELPADYTRPSSASARGGRRVKQLPDELVAALQAFARSESVTPFMLHLAAFSTLLFRLSHQKDFLVGIPVTGRDQLETEPLIGFFSNTLPLRLRPEAGLPFREFLRQTRDAVLRSYEHQDAPFEKVVEQAAIQRRANENPLVQVLFTVQNELDETVDMPGLVPSFEHLHTGTAKFDLTCTVTASRHRWSIELEFNADLFEAATIERWLGHLEILLASIVKEPDCALARLPLLSQGERQQLVNEWNATQIEYPRNALVHQLFEEQVRKTPKAIALVWAGGKSTYRDLNERANRLARHLERERGVYAVSSDAEPSGNGSPVAANEVSGGSGINAALRAPVAREASARSQLACVCLERSPELIIALLAILKTGSGYAALDPSLPTERLRELLEQLRPSCLITERKHLASLKALPAALTPPIVCLETEARRIAAESAADLPLRGNAGDVAYVCFTSGSTGRPKGVCVPHRGVVRLVKNNSYARLKADEVILQAAPISFDASTFEIWGALLNGGRLAVPPPGTLSISEVGAAIRRFGVTSAWFTAGLFNEIIEEASTVLKPLRQILVGGEALSLPHMTKARLAFPRATLINGYGPTENTTFSTCYMLPPVLEETRPVPIGRPIANSVCYILDEFLQPVPIGASGELMVGGDGLALGYLHQPELTAERFIPNPFVPDSRLYRTGDRARYLPDGNIEFLGRQDTQVKVRGFRVELAEIESVLLRHASVQNCAVVARRDRTGTNQLTAYIVLREPASATNIQAQVEAELRRYLASLLPDYMTPSAFLLLPKLPLSQNGKVDRGALPPPSTPGAATDDEQPPRNALEQQLQQIWQEVLCVRRPGIRQNFFSLGGHSLLAVRLVARIEKQLNRSVAVAMVFQHPTIELLAAALENETTASTGPTLVPLQPEGTRAPLVFVHGAGGGMLWGYANLARHLGADRPVLAFQPGTLDETQGLLTIEDLAASYISCLRKFQPTGPYYLGGYCFGGVVAYEIARQLCEAGDEVAFLVLINSAPPNSSYSHPQLDFPLAWKFARNAAWRIFDAVQSPGKWAAHLAFKARGRLRTWRERLGSSTSYDPQADQWLESLSVTDEELPLWQAHARALLRYHPKPYPGRLSLFRSPGHPWYCSFDSAFGWADLAQDGVSVTIVSGAHETILRPPSVEIVAQHLRKALS